MYLNAASCCSGGAVARIARPAPPVGQPALTSDGRKPVPNSNVASSEMRSTWAVDCMIEATVPFKKSCIRSCDVGAAQPSVTVERSHSPALMPFSLVSCGVNWSSEYAPPKAQMVPWKYQEMKSEAGGWLKPQRETSLPLRLTSFGPHWENS